MKVTKQTSLDNYSLTLPVRQALVDDVVIMLLVHLPISSLNKSGNGSRSGS